MMSAEHSSRNGVAITIALVFALQLGTVRSLGTFLPNPIDVPDSVLTFVGES